MEIVSVIAPMAMGQSPIIKAMLMRDCLKTVSHTKLALICGLTAIVIWAIGTIWVKLIILANFLQTPMFIKVLLHIMGLLQDLV